MQEHRCQHSPPFAAGGRGGEISTPTQGGLGVKIHELPGGQNHREEDGNIDADQYSRGDRRGERHARRGGLTRNLWGQNLWRGSLRSRLLAVRAESLYVTVPV